MLLKDVMNLPIYRTIEEICRYGKRNYGILPTPNYYGQDNPPENIKTAWTTFKNECIRLLREDKSEDCSKLVKHIGAIRYTRFQYESEQIVYNVRNAHLYSSDYYY